LNTTQRCQVPSGWTGPSHLLTAIHPPYRQPALAGGAAVISPPAVSGSYSGDDVELHEMTLTPISGWFAAFDVMVRWK
jgi:hypothetical protein